MSVMGLFFVFIASMSLLWLWRQGVMGDNWLEEGEVANCAGAAPSQPSAAKVGLGVFLAVAGCLFSLMTAAFFMRAASPDWQTPPMPGVLWFNTLALIASSATLQMAQFAAQRGDRDRVRSRLAASGAFSLVFLLGQLLAWRELADAGAYASGNPANAFFYLLTGAHGLHLVGGLVALARAIRRAWDDRPDATLATSVELCAIYWHFLLFVWLLLFMMLTGRAEALGAICRRILA
jgi:cytochrome c oxidase subunit III